MGGDGSTEPFCTQASRSRREDPVVVAIDLNRDRRAHVGAQCPCGAGCLVEAIRREKAPWAKAPRREGESRLWKPVRLAYLPARSHEDVLEHRVEFFSSAREVAFGVGENHLEQEGVELKVFARGLEHMGIAFHSDDPGMGEKSAGQARGASSAETEEENTPPPLRRE